MTRSLLKDRDFRLLWAGQGVSELGGSVTQVALPLAAVLTLHASAFQVGLLSAATMAAFLLVGLPAGALVDRRRRRPVLIRADLGRALLFGSIPVAGAFGWLTLGQLYLVALLGGVLRVFFDVAYLSYLPALVGPQQLVEGNSTLIATEAAAQVAGPGIGGALVGSIGAAATMTVDAVSYLVSFVSIALIRKPEPDVVVPEGGHLPVRQAVREGLAFVLREPTLRRITGCTAISNLSNGITTALETIYMVRTLGLSAGLVGLVFAVGSVGSVIGAAFAGRVGDRLGIGRAIVLGCALSAAGPLLFPFATPAHPLPLLLIGWVLIGLGVPLYNVTQLSLRQAITPPRLLGRMNASVRFVVWGILPIGGIIGGIVGSVAGIRLGIAVGALVGLAALPWIALSPVSRLRVVPAPVSD